MMQIFRPQVHERRFVAPAGPVAPAIAIGATALSTGLSIAGQARQAATQAGMANYQAQLARNSQMIAEWHARRAEEQGRVDEQQQRFRSASLLGAQRAALASQGADVNSGSPLDIQADTARAGELEARTSRSNAALKAYGLRLQAANAAADAGRYEAQGAQALANLPFGIGSSLLGGATSVADRWPKEWKLS